MVLSQPSSFTDKDSSFTVYSVMKYTRNLLLQSMHKDWYICQTKKKKKKSFHGKVDIKLDFYNGEPDVLNRCTFLFHPISEKEDKYKMCKDVIGPVKHPAITGQHFPHPLHLASETRPQVPALPSCIPVCSAKPGGGTPLEPAIGKPAAPTISGPSGSTGISVEPAIPSKCI